MKRPSQFVLACCVVCAMGAAGMRASPRGGQSLKLIKRQQKMARKQLKMEEKIWKRSFRGRHIPRAERLAQKHQLQREMRDLRRQQKDQVQEIKDRQRVMNYRRSHPY